MITFFLSIGLLVLGYVVYGTIVEKFFGADPNRKTPAVEINDGVDFVPLPLWKMFLIQFLNIAGLGPIFGAIAGAMWGPVAFLWIVLGCIIAGGVHDYFSGMLSIRHRGASISEVVGKYLGKGVMQFMRFFSIFLLIIVGVVFVKGPAGLLNGMTGININILIFCVFAYYIVATLLPIDKLIGKIYPIFGFSLLFMALGIGVMLIVEGYSVPELTLASLTNMHSTPEKFPIFPMLFVTIACGAISGFHSTQSPLMARCMTNEKQGRKVFYGTMITEGIVAVIWAAAAMAFFGGVGPLGDAMQAHGNNAAWVVNTISNTLLGKFGGIIALIGVVAAPITSGDTAFRSARLTIADAAGFSQHSIKRRLIITIPLFAVGFFLTYINFDILWRYLGWSNQTLSVFVLWTIVAYLIKEGKNPIMALVPATFMTGVCTTYILVAPEGFGLPTLYCVPIGIVVALIPASFSVYLKMKSTRASLQV